MDISNIYLSIYSFGYSAGFIKNNYKEDQLENFFRIDDLINLTTELGLGGIEIPIDRYFPNPEQNSFDELMNCLSEKNIGITFDLENFSPSYIIKIIDILKNIGISFLRIKMSNLYGGNRYNIRDFESLYKKFVENLNTVIPILKTYNFKLGIENHQDITSNELLAIINDISPKLIGVNWDIGSSLALGETPEVFFNKVQNHIFNIHIKDYKIFKNEMGIKLVRCPLGEGAVNFKNIFMNISDIDDVPMSIELGAMKARQSDIFIEKFWHKYPTSIASKREKFMKFIEKNCLEELDDNWKTCWEKNYSPGEIAKTELEEINTSVEFLKSL